MLMHGYLPIEHSNRVFDIDPLSACQLLKYPEGDIGRRVTTG